MSWVVRTAVNFGWGQRDLRIGLKDFQGTLRVVQPFTFKTYERHAFIDVITLPADGQNNPEDFIQAVVDHAAEIGIFPSKLTAPTREIDAIKYHLEDMRKLVFK